MLKRFVFLTVLSLALCCTVTTGCGKNKHGTVPVTVTVTYNGKPVDEAVVVFTSETTGDFSSGATNKSGVAKLSAYEPNDGAKPGVYVVTIDKSELKEERDPNDPMGDRILKSETIFHIPAVYGNVKTSGLTAEVVEGKKNSFVFNLDDSNPNEVVPNEFSIE
ncbi:MAG: hypothetical protein Q4G03_04600 [Planctomycetia bacterium]|nr:hypothetical protein [Planctomycetia bacterium]